MSWLMRNREHIGLTADILALGDFVHAIIAHGGSLALAGGMVASAVGGVFCGLSLSVTSKFWRAVAWVGLGLGIVLFCYFTPALIVRLFVREPDPEGDFEGSDPPVPFVLAIGNDSKYLEGRYTAKFPRPADAAHVLLVISETDRNQFEAFQIENTVGAHDRTKTLGNLPANVVGIRVFNADPKESVGIDLLARRKTGAPDRTTLDVVYRYYKRTLWWEYKSWVYRTHR